MRNDKDEVLRSVAGMWPQAIMAICPNVTSETFRKKHGPCPSCGGKDRFRFDDHCNYAGDGGNICGQCGSGDGIYLLQKLTGMNFGECINDLAAWVGHVPFEKREAVKVEVSARASQEKYGTYLSHDECVAALDKCAVGLSIDNLRHGIAAEVNLRHTDKGSFIFAPVSLAATPGQLCDVAVMNSDHHVKFMSGGMPAGGVTIIKGEGEYVYLCSSWLDAWHTHYGTGAEVWCCWSSTNLAQVAFRNKDAKLRVSCLHSDLDTIFAADETGLDIILPRHDIWSKGIPKKLHKAGELCAK